MAKILFDIKYRPQIESGEYKVETKAGSPAKVMDWEYNNKTFGKCLAIKVIEGDGDHALLYTCEGKRSSIFPAEEGYDLFIITPEPELSEFENKLRVICEDAVRESQLFPERTSEDFAKKHSAELLVLAEKEIAKGHEHDVYIPEDTYYEQLKKQWEDGYGKGKTKALKDLPRWEKNKSFETEGTFMGVKGRECFVVKDGYSISVAELIKKLPGFKEDGHE